MMLREIVADLARGDAPVRVRADERVLTELSRVAGSELPADATPAPGDVVVLDARDLTVLDEVASWPEGVLTVLLLAEPAHQVAVGRVIQAGLSAGLAFVTALPIEPGWFHRSAVVAQTSTTTLQVRPYLDTGLGSEHAAAPEPATAEQTRRLAWEWGLGDLVGRARDEAAAEALGASQAEVEQLRAELAAAKADATRQVAEAQAKVTAAERRAEREALQRQTLADSASLRVGQAVVGGRKHPITSVRQIAGVVRDRGRRSGG